MLDTGFEYERKNKQISLIISIFIHVILIALIFFWSKLKYDFPPPGKEGVLIVFGDVAESINDSDNESASTKQVDKATSEKLEKEITKENNTKPKDNAELKKVLTEDNDVVLTDSDKNIHQEKEVIPEKNIDDAKNEFSKLFSFGGTKKKGEGKQGDPLGAKDAEILEGITRGKGKIGEGLDSRGILYEPNFEDSSQKSGRVVIRVCINETGNVISSKYTQRGSSTTDSELIAIAERNTKKYRFVPSNKKEQCGTITIDFIVK